jgi:hypothetical protein
VSRDTSTPSTEPGSAQTAAAPASAASQSSARQAWVAPKVTFVEPKLTNHGPLTDVTGAFFGGFSPGGTS